MRILLALSDAVLQQEIAALMGALDHSETETEILQVPDVASGVALASTLDHLRFLFLDGEDPAVQVAQIKSVLQTVHPILELVIVKRDPPVKRDLPTLGARTLRLPLTARKLALALGYPEPNVPPSLEAGTCLGSCRILTEEAPHARGRTFRASQSSLDRPVTLTVLDPRLFRDLEQREAFLHEARIRARVVHPHILAIYEAGESEGHFFYASERLESGTLEDALQTGQKLPLRTLVQIALCIGGALHYLASHAFHHPPLEPGHVHLGVSPQLANLATDAGGDATQGVNAFEENIAVLGKTLLQLAPADLPDFLRILLERTQHGAGMPFPDWDSFLIALRDQQPGEMNGGLREETVSTGRRGRKEKQRRERALILGGLAACALLFLALLLWAQRKSHSPELKNRAACSDPSFRGFSPDRKGARARTPTVFRRTFSCPLSNIGYSKQITA